MKQFNFASHSSIKHFISKVLLYLPIKYFFSIILIHLKFVIIYEELEIITLHLHIYKIIF